jgi:predicted oxidoreductase
MRLQRSEKPSRLGSSKFSAFPISYGMWRFAGTDVKSAQEKVETALDVGINLFDQADVYGCDGAGKFGDSEELFGDVLRASPSLRERMIIATKGGIVLGVPYDSSPNYLRIAVENSLRRLKIDSIDLYQIHRPDFLGHPERMASALTELRESGKIKEVGVSNYSTSQFNALQAYLPFSIVTHQPEFSCLKHDVLRDGILDQCMEKRVTPLAWSPLAGGAIFSSVEDATDSKLAALITVLDRVANEQNVTRTAVALAWTMVHPSGVIPIIGTQKPSRIRESLTAFDVSFSRTEWNEILVAAQGYPLP